MEKPEIENNNQNRKTPKPPRINSYWIYAAVILLLLISQFVIWGNTQGSRIGFNELKTMVTAGDVSSIKVINQEVGEVYLKKESVSKYPQASRNTFSDQQPNFSIDIGPPQNFVEKLDALNNSMPENQKVEVYFENKSNFLGTLLTYVFMIFIFIALYMFIMRRVGGSGGGPAGQIFNIGKSKATLFEKNAKVDITFADVAGLDEAKEEIMEIVDFLKNPKKYTSVGASRVRDLFKQAREKAPCIVFIDEIDAIGRARGKNNFQGGNDERENTLNQLLVEMDGFSTDKGVILMAATNRSDVLDSALMRPGRFDRQIGIDRPDLNGRIQIFNVHLRGITTLAEMTPGFAGADIANVCNEAALIAARRNKTSVDMDDFNYALDRVIGGLEKKNTLISPEEKKIISYHEAGHAVCGWFLEHAMPLVKVTIVPRGIGTLGYAQYLPKEEYITRTEQLLDRICMTFGGRAAEQIVFGKISTGAQSDLDQVTKLAYSMVTVYGMNGNVGNVSFYSIGKDSFQKPFSEHTSAMIDEEVRKLLDEQYQRCVALLTQKRDELELLAQRLLEKEVMHKSDVEALIGPRPWKVPDPLAFPNEEKAHDSAELDKNAI